MSTLDEIETRLAAATPAPWKAIVLPRESHKENAAVIAHAPTDLAALVAVVRQVEALHKPGPESADGVVCFECAPALWPCPTTTAVQGLEATT